MMSSSYAKCLLAGYTLAVAAVSLTPAETLQQVNANDKMAHFACYGLFALLLGTVPLRTNQYLIGGVLLALYGLALEGLQSLVPGRDCSLLDALANTAGVATGLSLLLIYFRVRQARAKSV